MVKAENFGHLHLVYHFTIPMKNLNFWFVFFVALLLITHDNIETNPGQKSKNSKYFSCCIYFFSCCLYFLLAAFKWHNLYFWNILKPIKFFFYQNDLNSLLTKQLYNLNCKIIKIKLIEKKHIIKQWQNIYETLTTSFGC